MDDSSAIGIGQAETQAGCAGDAPPPQFDLRDCALLLDVDGTILEIAPAPDRVHVPDGLCELLLHLRERTGGALALISGRPLADIDELFAPLDLAAIGCHGAEIRGESGGEALIHAPPLDARLRERLLALGTMGQGIVIEDKRYGIALHYRLAPEVARPLVRAVEEAAAEFAETGVTLMRGKSVIEAKSAGVDKGTAFRALMEKKPFAGRRAVFVGDDVTDEAVFAVLPEFGGYGISVGRAIDGTQFCFPRAQDVRVWLALLADQ